MQSELCKESTIWGPHYKSMDPCYPGEEHRADDGSGEPSHLLGELPTSACEWFDCSFTTLPSFKVVATWMALQSPRMRSRSHLQLAVQFVFITSFWLYPMIPHAYILQELSMSKSPKNDENRKPGPQHVTPVNSTYLSLNFANIGDVPGLWMPWKCHRKNRRTATSTNIICQFCFLFIFACPCQRNDVEMLMHWLV